MVLIQTVKCENGMEARAKEREYIVELNATLNKVQRPIVSQQEEQERKNNGRKTIKDMLNKETINIMKTTKKDTLKTLNNIEKNIRKN